MRFGPMRFACRIRILVWQGDKPKTRIQERAREARYELLCACAAEIGADYLVTAHHADDQAETILFRLLRGSGFAGLAGMPRMAQRGGLTFLRPLLDCPKSALIAVCEAQDQPYFRDPSNENPAFARAQLRRLLPLLAEEGLDREALLRLGRRAARVDLALDATVEKLRARLPATRDEDSFSAPIGALAAEPAEILGRLIEAEIQRVASARPVRLDRLEVLDGVTAGGLAKACGMARQSCRPRARLGPQGKLDDFPGKAAPARPVGVSSDGKFTFAGSGGHRTAKIR